MNDLPQPPPNAFDRWSVSVRMTDAGDGSASVEALLFNEAHGALPPITMQVDWKPGMEARDVEGHALTLMMQSAAYLSDTLLRAAIERRR